MVQGSEDALRCAVLCAVNGERIGGSEFFLLFREQIVRQRSKVTDRFGTSLRCWSLHLSALERRWTNESHLQIGRFQ